MPSVMMWEKSMAMVAPRACTRYRSVSHRQAGIAATGASLIGCRVGTVSWRCR